MKKIKSMLLGIGSADINKGRADAAAHVAAFEKRLASVKAFIDVHYIDDHIDDHIDDRIDDHCIDDRYIDDHCIDVSVFYESASEPASTLARQKESAKKDTRRLSDLMKELEDTFSEHLLKLIDQKGKTDVETYKRANMDRKLFSKIRSDKHYQPSKSTALALAIALELNLDETKNLLQKAGFALSRSSQADLVIEYFITEGVFQIDEINEILFEFDQPLLGANR